ncbi:MAG: WD40 repeat domain-containing serine/threonine protein kinase, partial [Planctomycetaceae bacterium]
MLCPSDSVFERLVADKLPALLEERIAKHLETCPSCRQKAQLAYSRLRLEVINPGDATVGADSGMTCAEPQDLHADLYRLITGDEVQASNASERIGELFRLLAATPGDEVSGAKLGRFTVQRWLGAGGFGVVFLAYDDLLHREIALKLPRAQALLHREMRRRFLREAEAAAKLHHPNIVPVFEAGVEQGVCYIASEYCPGPTLDAWYAEQAKPIAVSTAVAIVRQLAEAVEHAHQHQVLHRDIKPSNVLLKLNPLQPLAPTPKITDFGLAKLIDADASMTANQGMLGTPRYMSPEQAAGDRSVTGPATDIFALGAVLYELLTGTAPYAGNDQAQTLHRLFFDRVVPPRRVRPDLPRDLEAICLKCLERKGEDRYGAAQDLADDLQRFESGHTTLARPLSRMEMLRRWTVRQPAIAALLTTVGLGLLSLLGILAVYSQSLKSFNAEIQTALHDTRQAQLAAEEQRAKLRNLLYASKIDLAHQAIREKDLRQAFKLLNEIRSETSGVASNFVSRYLWNQVTAQGREIFEGTDDLYELQFSPGGEQLAAGGADSVLRLFDSKTFALLHSVPTEQGEINGIAFSPDEATVVTAGDDGTLRYWDFDTLAPGRVLAAHQRLAFSAVFTPDGKTLITCGDEPLIRLWNAATGESEGVLQGHTRSVESIAISPDGLHLASASSDATLRVWDLATRQTKHVLRGHTNRVVDVQFSPQGHSLLSGSLDHTIRRWRVSDGQCLQIETHVDPITSVGFLSNDSLFVAADRGGAVHVWRQKEPKPGQKVTADPAAVPLHNWKAHADRAWNVTPTPDRTGLVTAGAEGRLYVWERPPAVEASVEVAANDAINDFA